MKNSKEDGMKFNSPGQLDRHMQKKQSDKERKKDKKDIDKGQNKKLDVWS